MSIDWQIKTFGTLASTQNTLKEMISGPSEVKEGTVILARLQKNGYGRHNRKWQGEEGNLSISFLVTPPKKQSPAAQISIITGISLIKTIKSFIDTPDLKLKWPNDVMINNKKCAGILVESTGNKTNANMIIGLGVNIANAPLAISSALNEYVSKDIEVNEFTNKFLNTFSEDYTRWNKEGFKPFKDQFITHTYNRKTAISVNVGSKQITGAFIDIDNDGNLEIMCNKTQSIQKITSGEVFVM